jgi:hypothetical protein
MRLHIIGIPSAGKTTLGTHLSSILRVPHHDLDSLVFLDEHWTLRTPTERDAMLAQILEEPSFVTEGGFLGWTTPLFAVADHIVWLDPPLRTLRHRHIRRHRGHARMLPSLLLFQIRMYRRPEGAGPLLSDPDQTREGIARALRPWASKVVRVKGPVTAQDVVEGLGVAGPPAQPPKRASN